MPHFNQKSPAVPFGEGFDELVKKPSDTKPLTMDFPQSKEDPDLTELKERVEKLERLIKLTFNGHVLIKGKFVDIAHVTKEII